jgi:hypothetical protein
MNISTTAARNQPGCMLERCQSRPVLIEKSGRRHSVLISAAHDYELMQAQRKGARSRDAGKAFAKRYGGWVLEQQEHFERLGVWNEEFRSC